MSANPTGLRVAEDRPPAGPVISGFSGNGFRIDGTAMAGALLTPEWARPWAEPAVTTVALAPLLDVAPLPEFLLLGTGGSLVRPSPRFIAAIEALGMGVEAMDSRAAARAWGVLRGEGRWIVAALMPL